MKRAQSARIWAAVLATALVVLAIGAALADASGSSRGSQAISPGALAEMKARIAAYSRFPPFKAPGPPINPKALAGKSIFTVPFATTVPFCAGLDAEMKKVAKQFGIKFDDYPNQGQPSQWVAGLQTALTRKPDLVNIFCGIDPSNLQPQVKALNRAHIPVVSSHNYDPSSKPGSGLAGVVFAQYMQAGVLEADWVIVQTKGNANVLVVRDSSDPSTPPLIAGIKREFAKCPGCKVTYASVAVPDWGTKIGPIVSSTITANSKLNYVIPIYDGMVQPVIPAIVAAGATNRVHVATFNGTPAVLRLIQQHRIVTFDVGEDFPGLARAVLDQDFRIMLGKPPAKRSFAALRIFSSANVGQAGNPPSYLKGYGPNTIQGFAKLWGQKG